MSMTIRRNSRENAAASPLAAMQAMPPGSREMGESTPSTETLQPFLTAWAAQEMPLRSAASAHALAHLMFADNTPNAALHTVQAESLVPSSVARVLRQRR